jgi:hypothetical protein
MGEREIFLLMKWEKILDLIKVSRFTLVPSLATLGDDIVSPDATSTSILLLGTQM